MLSKEYFEKYYADFSEEQLIKLLLTEKQKYTEEAIYGIEKALEKKGGGITKIIEQERKKDGKILLHLSDVKIVNPLGKERLLGDFYITQDKMYFIPEFVKMSNDSFGGALVYQFATLGLIAYSLIDSQLNKPKNISINKVLPLSLQSKYIEFSRCSPVNDITKVVSSQKADYVYIHTNNNGVWHLNLPNASAKIQVWDYLRSKKINIEQPHGFFGITNDFFERISRKGL